MRYRDFSVFLRERFPFKVQKISIDAGFSCPNRDGTIGIGGCTYCNNRSFNPDYCAGGKSITEQLEEGKAFFGKKYPEMHYLAYFQAYTNTYGPTSELIRLYEEALSVSKVAGIVIATRPDCISDEILDFLADLNKKSHVIIEYGVETANNDTLKRVNRGHTWEQTKEAIQKTHQRNIDVGAHLILGLPGEAATDIFETIQKVSATPINTLKLHQLQVIKGTHLAKQIENGEVTVAEWSVDDYIRLCGEIIRLLPASIAIERFTSQSPGDLLISPKWGLKNYEFTNLLNNYLCANNITQGDNILP